MREWDGNQDTCGDTMRSPEENFHTWFVCSTTFKAESLRSELAIPFETSFKVSLAYLTKILFKQTLASSLKSATFAERKATIDVLQQNHD